ncbi:phosphotransferase [Ornithinibacillus scapharcae]|uniref:phosphotransferase n=1 Tax=Ornithinibacillus scapharcae TaxID=1147159 RepID=UPI000225ADBF|nr:phosphotransferase [Ornithinibacillus scapharcae]
MPQHKFSVDWIQDSYLRNVESWVHEELGKAGLLIKRKIERIKVNDMSIVLRIPTNDGDVYFKVGNHASKHEAILSRELTITSPGKTAEVYAINETEGWLLMKDIKGQSLRTLKDRKTWQKALAEFAELQIKESYNVDRLLEIGVPDRRGHNLKKEIRQSLEEMCATGLSKEETSQVMALLPTLLDMCDDIAAIIPASIEHGDLHSDNIRLIDNKFVFYDWGDASISNPFFSTRVIWHALDELITSESEWLEMVEEFRPYYLEPWTKIASMKELDRALRISDELACVQRALSWHLYITPNRLDKKDSYHKPSQWLRLLLEHRLLVGK